MTTQGSTAKKPREFTGRMALATVVGAFSVVIGVNLILAYEAVSTFPGLEVPNSYVASQTWDAERKAQIALGWSLTHDYRDGKLILSFRDAAGRPVAPASIDAVVGRPTEAVDDVKPAFAFDGTDMVAPVALRPGKWMILMEAFAKDGTLFRKRLDLFVKG